MKYEIKGDNLPVVIVTLENGEAIFTESGGMSWMSEHIKMETNTKGGLIKGLRRSLSGDSLFMTTYTAERENSQIAFCSSFPGEIKAITLQAGQSIICQKRSFLAGAATLDVDMYFKKNIGVGIFGGEGFILQRISGPGTVFVEMDGALMEYDLAPGQVMKVDQGHIGMFEESVSFDIQAVKGMKNIFLSGEGLFLATLKGPGKAWLQTMPLSNLVQLISASLPPKS
ncbi:TIGR00266 family protein [Acetobacterium woodii]|uniref:TIGR00266 family protein n=1 Tax=Acetobacterium woodii (strain ATCC 29683 / DSM 1030 / JCM 2381 / KCTC 1655 / WB1) TaxID=931626 RepID=H6LH18_ACEWD|nr:TIGR00266 family protein [Acetobacterium woodii]AFA47156.1 hypothetical protein Awo_c03550 [Acetobacterium woodii DSM 1030]